MNNITTPGVYAQWNDNTPLNAPTTQYNATILVYNMRPYEVWQIWASANTKNVWTRMKAGGTWTDWQKQPTRAEVDALNRKSYSGLEVRRDTQNVTTFTFSNLPDINAARYKHFIVVYGDASNATTLAVYHGAINTTGGVVLNAIEKGSGAVTITASVTDNALKITGTSAIYGGVRLIWLS